MENKVEKYYDEKGTAKHYNIHRINCLIMTEKVWGTKALMMHYEMVVFEYKYRLGKKDSDSLEQEMLKINWYETAIEYLQNKLDAGNGLIGLTDINHPLPSEMVKKLNKKA